MRSICDHHDSIYRAKSDSGSAQISPCGSDQKKQHFRGSSVWTAYGMLCRKMGTLNLILSMAKRMKMKEEEEEKAWTFFIKSTFK